MKKTLEKILVTGMMVCLMLTCMIGTNSPVTLPTITAEAAQVETQTSSTQDRSGYFNKNFRITGNNAKDIISVATAQLNKNGRDLHYSEEWCSDFVNDCAKLAKISSSVIPYTYTAHGGCIYLYRYMIRNCGAKTVSVSDAQPGDIIFFDWSGKKNPDNFHHVAIVTEVKNGRIYFIGGNQTSANTLYTRKVTKSSYAVGNSNIGRVIRSNYKTPTPVTPSSNDNTYFPKYTGTSSSIVIALQKVGANSTYSYRTLIAAANGIKNYYGTSAQNVKLLNLLKKGQLKKPSNAAVTNVVKTVVNTVTVKYFPKYTGSSGSIVIALQKVGANSTYSYRSKIAAANGIKNYSGTASQNTKLVTLIKQGKLEKP